MSDSSPNKKYVAAEWIDPDGLAVRGEIIARALSFCTVNWPTGVEHGVRFDDPDLRFLTAYEL